MKKLNIIIMFGAFIVITVLLGINTNKMYQKQKHFETASEVIEQLKSNPLTVIDAKRGSSETNELKECLSERKRLTSSQFNFQKMEIEKVEELSEKQKQLILKDYDARRNEFSKRRVITKEEPVRLNVTVYDNYYMQNGTIEYNNPQNINLDLVFIDESEGLVIDYIMQDNTEKSTEEGNKDA